MPKTPPPTRRTPTPPHLKPRLAAVRTRLTTWHADALLVTNPTDTRYLTGFVGDDSWTLITQTGFGSAKPLIFTDFRFKEQIAREAPHALCKIRKRSLTDALADELDRRRIKKLAIQNAYVTLSLRATLVKRLGAARLTPVDDALIAQRAVKSPDEVAAIRKALAIQQEAYRLTLRWLKPGLTERQVAAYLEYQMRNLGADGVSFPSIVASGPSAALPHAIPGPTRIKKNTPLLIDWGARARGYCGDLTRVVALGTMPKKIRTIYQVVRDAQLAAIDAIAPGVAPHEIDAKARKIIARAGYGRHFGHALGHGLGLDVHEQPTLSANATAQLRPGHVVTVEPGIYLPGLGGVRIEDDVLVTPRGRRVLSDLPTDIESAMI